ncbi:uncharacterized protein YhfF [Gracilibacillus halotolerans]|uniref:Uncharacterized protein YhfF n=1 Tax=Gracilibacillus halotolerans TaxID=74386 RepID=A0A841RMY9_9BACI|nr:ASCH domain-containing protein [Gracilibacillus halotolerans]MBB6513227.1 uncharacterized protein YhfF [Gracilibacillus halotolerans]
MNNDSIKQLWEEYNKINPNAPDHYDAWPFGNSKEMADELAKLVVEGTKSATASNYTMYQIDDEPLPYIGLHNIILDGNGEAVAVMETVAVEIVPFDEVTEEHAYLEGEGDRSLSYWRKVHEDFLKKELEGIQQPFHNKIPVVCEKLKLLYVK